MFAPEWLGAGLRNDHGQYDTSPQSYNVPCATPKCPLRAKRLTGEG